MPATPTVIHAQPPDTLTGEIRVQSPPTSAAGLPAVANALRHSGAKHLKVILAAEPELASQVIRPYSDLLLHDMGPGLADGRPDGLANGQEWKTPPLWGIGLFADVNGHTRYLHDGRARNLSEAILWHGGEAEAAKQRFMAFNKTDRAALLRFLESL